MGRARILDRRRFHTFGRYGGVLRSSPDVAQSRGTSRFSENSNSHLQPPPEEMASSSTGIPHYNIATPDPEMFALTPPGRPDTEEKAKALTAPRERLLSGYDSLTETFCAPRPTSAPAKRAFDMSLHAEVSAERNKPFHGGRVTFGEDRAFDSSTASNSYIDILCRSASLGSPMQTSRSGNFQTGRAGGYELVFPYSPLSTQIRIPTVVMNGKHPGARPKSGPLFLDSRLGRTPGGYSVGGNSLGSSRPTSARAEKVRVEEHYVPSTVFEDPQIIAGNPVMISVKDAMIDGTLEIPFSSSIGDRVEEEWKAMTDEERCVCPPKLASHIRRMMCNRGLQVVGPRTCALGGALKRVMPDREALMCVSTAATADKRAYWPSLTESIVRSEDSNVPFDKAGRDKTIRGAAKLEKMRTYSALDKNPACRAMIAGISLRDIQQRSDIQGDHEGYTRWLEYLWKLDSGTFESDYDCSGLSGANLARYAAAALPSRAEHVHPSNLAMCVVSKIHSSGGHMYGEDMYIDWNRMRTLSENLFISSSLYERKSIVKASLNKGISLMSVRPNHPKVLTYQIQKSAMWNADPRGFRLSFSDLPPDYVTSSLSNDAHKSLVKCNVGLMEDTAVANREQWMRTVPGEEYGTHVSEIQSGRLFSVVSSFSVETKSKDLVGALGNQLYSLVTQGGQEVAMELVDKLVVMRDCNTKRTLSGRSMNLMAKMLRVHYPRLHASMVSWCNMGRKTPEQVIRGFMGDYARFKTNEIGEGLEHSWFDVAAVVLLVGRADHWSGAVRRIIQSVYRQHSIPKILKSRQVADQSRYWSHVCREVTNSVKTSMKLRFRARADAMYACAGSYPFGSMESKYCLAGCHLARFRANCIQTFELKFLNRGAFVPHKEVIAQTSMSIGETDLNMILQCSWTRFYPRLVKKVGDLKMVGVNVKDICPENPENPFALWTVPRASPQNMSKHVSSFSYAKEELSYLGELGKRVLDACTKAVRGVPIVLSGLANASDSPCLRPARAPSTRRALSVDSEDIDHGDIGQYLDPPQNPVFSVDALNLEMSPDPGHVVGGIDGKAPGYAWKAACSEEIKTHINEMIDADAIPVGCMYDTYCSIEDFYDAIQWRDPTVQRVDGNVNAIMMRM